MSFKKVVQKYCFFMKYANILINNFDISAFFCNFACKWTHNLANIELCGCWFWYRSISRFRSWSCFRNRKSAWNKQKQYPKVLLFYVLKPYLICCVLTFYTESLVLVRIVYFFEWHTQQNLIAVVDLENCFSPYCLLFWMTYTTLRRQTPVVPLLF